MKGKIDEIESQGNVAIVTPGHTHAFQMKNVINDSKFESISDDTVKIQKSKSPMAVPMGNPMEETVKKQRDINTQFSEYLKLHSESEMTKAEFTKKYEEKIDKAASVVVVRRGSKPKVNKRRGSKLDVNGNIRGDK